MPCLIDADALKEAMNYNGGCGICFRYIDNADTIPAIPAEWLEWRVMNAIKTPPIKIRYTRASILKIS